MHLCMCHYWCLFLTSSLIPRLFIVKNSMTSEICLFQKCQFISFYSYFQITLSVIWCQQFFLLLWTSPPLTSHQYLYLSEILISLLTHIWFQGTSQNHSFAYPLVLFSLHNCTHNLHRVTLSLENGEGKKKMKKWGLSSVWGVVKCGPGTGSGIMKWSIYQIMKQK